MFKVLRELFRLINARNEQEGVLHVSASSGCTISLKLRQVASVSCVFDDPEPMPDPCNPAPTDICRIEKVWLGGRWGVRLTWSVSGHRRIHWKASTLAR